MTPRQLRIVRGSSASVTATLIAALSHTLGGGQLPHPLLILAVSVLLTPIASLLVGRATRLPSIVAAVGVTQAVFHLLFDLTGATVGSGPHVSGHQHGALDLTALAQTPSASLAHTSHGDAAMIFAHACAAAVTAVMLWRGELMLSMIAHWVRAVLRRPEPLPEPQLPAVRPLLCARLAPTIARVSLGDVCRRGPPAFSCG